MFVPVLLLAVVGGAPTCTADPAPRTPPVASAVAGDSTLLALYARGVDYPRFLAAARARRETWVRNGETAVVPADALALARTLTGHWRILVVAVDGCSDSANTIPYVAKLVEMVPALELRVVSPEAGQAVMEAHRTPDGRAATPTILVLDGAGREVGCWIERPKALQDQAIAARAAGTIERFASGKQGWYDADAGASTVREIVAVLQAAAAGAPRCDVASGPLPRPAPGQ